MTEFLELFLTCADLNEADMIAQSLLNQHLVACVKFEPVHSKFWWQGVLDEGDEIKISMLSVAGNFDRIETEVAKLHSYDTFVLQATPISHLNQAVVNWLVNSTK